MKVAYLTNMIPPYRAEFLNELADRCELVVVADSLVSKLRSWKMDSSQFRFQLKILQSKEFTYQLKRPELGFEDVRDVNITARVLPTLKELQPDVIMTAEMGFRTVQAIMYARRARVPVVLGWEGTALTEASRGWVRRRLRKWIANRVDRAWSNGVLSTNYLVGLGLAEAKCDPGMTGVATGHFRSQVYTLLPQREAIRQQLGLSGTIFLFCGRLTKAKGVHLLLQAAALAAPQIPGGLSLLFVGEGEMRADIESFKTQHPHISVALTGFVQIDELPRYYAVADVFTVPTLIDNWPLVSLEALASGLPQIFSSYNGCVPDLLTRPEVGVVCDPMKLDDYAQALVAATHWRDHRVPEEVTTMFSDYYSPACQAERGLASLQRAVDEYRKP